ncbi:MAG TPA: MlaD family protein [Ferruginibacter sp.]|nr:MlaD family protein [Ferruginibacter sp.]
MKISNETKVGAVAIVAITFLVLGFNFLKGKTFFSSSTTLYAKYSNVQGLASSNPIVINGLQVGTVYKISTDKDMRQILVNMNITKDINIPINSIAMIKQNPIGGTSIEIKLGDDLKNLKNNDTMYTEANAGIFNEILKKVDPVLYEVKKAVSSLDTLLGNVNSVIDPRAKNNIGATLENLNKVTASMIVSTAALEQLLNAQSGALAKTLNNVSSITGNLASNNEKINSVVTNLDKTTTKLAQLDLQKTLSSLDSTINNLKSLTGKFNSNDGTLGLLFNDPSLYKNLASTSNKLNLLLDDIRVNPKRYVSVSIFGKKQNNQPLMVPLPDTISSPYIIKKAD